MTGSCDSRVALPLQIQNAVVKSSICLSTVKAGYCFDILRNESASTDKSSDHHGPSLSTRPLLTFVFEFELALETTPGTGTSEYTSLTASYA